MVKPGGTECRGGHLGEAGTLAAEDVLHGGGACRPGLTEEVD
jgi:hypothetical protein